MQAGIRVAPTDRNVLLLDQVLEIYLLVCVIVGVMDVRFERGEENLHQTTRFNRAAPCGWTGAALGHAAAYLLHMRAIPPIVVGPKEVDLQTRLVSTVSYPHACYAIWAAP